MKIRVVVDRIEDKRLAVLEIEGVAGDFVWPLEFLPPGAHEGSILDFVIEADPQAEEEQRRRIRKLREELLKRSETGPSP